MEVNSDAVPGSLDAGDMSVEADVEAFLVAVGESLGDVVVEGAEQPRSSVHDGDLGTERSEHVTHLSRHVAAAHHHHRRRQRLDPHDGVRGVKRHLAKADDLGQARSGADREHNLFAADLLAGDVEDPGRHESGLAQVHVDPATTSKRHRFVGQRIDTPEHPVADGGPVGADQVGVDAVAAGVAHRLGHVGRVHEHFRRDTAPVEAGSAEPITLDDRHPQTVQALDWQHVARPRPDDHQVIVGHHRMIRAAGQRHLRPRPQRRVISNVARPSDLVRP